MNKASNLVKHWRDDGPVAWSESPYGWIDVDGEPITLEPWQRAVLAAWWAHRDAVTTLGVSCIKKSGKTTLDAILTAWRWLSLPGLHYCVANDLDQAGTLVFQMIADMVKRNGYLRRNVKTTAKEMVFTPTGSTIRTLAVDDRGAAGANFVTASFTEAWGVIYEQGRRMWEEMTPIPGRFYGLPCLRIADSYAGYEGESDTWHSIVDRGLAGQRVDPDWPIYRADGLLLFHADGAEAQARCFRGTPAEAEAYYSEQKTSLRPGAYLRLHENKRATGSEQFIDPAWWNACIDAGHRPLLPGSSVSLFAGVDAAYKNDSAAVVACYFDRASRKIALACHRIWKPAGEALDLDATIGDELRRLRAGYNLRRVLYDPYQMVNLAQQLQRDRVPLEEYPQSVPNLTAMGQNLYDLIKGGNLIVYADDDLRKQVSHAVAVESSRGWRIAKEKAANKIDAVVALAMAALAAVEGGAVALPASATAERSGVHAVPLRSSWDSQYDPNRAPLYPRETHKPIFRR